MRGGRDHPKLSVVLAVLSPSMAVNSRKTSHSASRKIGQHINMHHEHQSLKQTPHQQYISLVECPYYLTSPLF